MRTRLGRIMLGGYFLLAVDALSATESTKEDSWDNLNQVTHSTIYTFLERKGNCVAGEIVTATDQGVTVRRLNTTTGKRPNYSAVHIERPNVLRVMESPKVFDVVYSGRSSWSDVEGIQGIPPYEALLFTTKDGKRHKGKVIDISDKHVRLAQSNKATEIAKDDVSQISYIREKPASASAKYAAQEMFHPRPGVVATHASYSTQDYCTAL